MVSKMINTKVFNELLKTYIVTNEELSLKKRKEDGLKSAIEAIKKISNKMACDNSGIPISLRGFLIFFLPILFAGVYYDVQKNGSWDESSTAKALNMSGVYKYTNKALDRAREGTLWMHERIEEQFPGVTDRTMEIAMPYVEFGRDLGIIMCNNACDLKKYVSSKIPVLIETIDSYVPGLRQQVQDVGNNACTAIMLYYNKSRDYLLSEVFVGKMAPEELQKMISQGYETGLDKASEYCDWIYEKVMSTIK